MTHNTLTFSRAAPRYDTFSFIQRHIASQLAAPVSLHHKALALDLGCGSGAVTLALMNTYPSIKIIGIDRAAGMCRRYADATAKPVIQASADHLPIKDNSVGMVVSSMALHWLSSSQRVQAFCDMRRVCHTQASIYIAIPVLGSLVSFFDMLDTASPMPLRRVIFPELQHCLDEFHKAGLHVETVREEYPEEYFTEPRAMLRYTKHIGANITGGKAAYPGKMFLQRFSDAFYGDSTPEKGVAMRWRIAYIVASLY